MLRTVGAIFGSEVAVSIATVGRHLCFSGCRFHSNNGSDA